MRGAAPPGAAAGRSRRSPPAAAARLSATTRRARVPDQRGRRSGTSRCGITLVNQEPGPSTTQSAPATAATASGQAGGAGRHQRAPRRTRPAVVATATWPRIRRTRAGSASSSPTTSASMSSGRGLIGSTRPLRAEQPADRVQRGHRVAQRLPRPAISRLPTACPASSPAPPKRCCSTPRPGPAPVVVAAQRGQRHPQVAGRQHAELAAQPAARAAVVGDRDDRGDVRR